MALVRRTFEEIIMSPKPASVVRIKFMEALLTGWTMWSIDPSSSEGRVLATAYANQKETDKYWYAFESIARFLAGNPSVGLSAGHMSAWKLRRRVRIDLEALIPRAARPSTLTMKFLVSNIIIDDSNRFDAPERHFAIVKFLERLNNKLTSSL